MTDAIFSSIILQPFYGGRKHQVSCEIRLGSCVPRGQGIKVYVKTMR